MKLLVCAAGAAMLLSAAEAFVPAVLPPGSSFRTGVVAVPQASAPIATTAGTAATSRRSCSRTSLAMGVTKEGPGFEALDGEAVRVGIIKTRWNPEIIGGLSEGVKEALKKCNVTEANIFETEVPGAFELPLAAKFLAASNRVDTIVCLGCLIKGDTMHFEYIADAVSKGLMNVGLNAQVPVTFGVLTVLNEQQAKDRSSGDNNHGVEWGMTAVEMGLLRMSALGQKGGAAAKEKVVFGKLASKKDAAKGKEGEKDEGDGAKKKEADGKAPAKKQGIGF